MTGVWTKLNRVMRTTALIALVIGTMGSGGGELLRPQLAGPSAKARHHLVRLHGGALPSAVA